MGIHLYSAVLDPDLEITGGGRVGVGERPVSKKKVFWPFEPQFGLKIRGGGGRAGPLSWICHCSGTINHIARGACG